MDEGLGEGSGGAWDRALGSRSVTVYGSKQGT